MAGHESQMTADGTIKFLMSEIGDNGTALEVDIIQYINQLAFASNFLTFFRAVFFFAGMGGGLHLVKRLLIRFFPGAVGSEYVVFLLCCFHRDTIIID